MGADIHGVWQEKIGQTWHTCGLVPDSRNYVVFGKLAGVRNYEELDPIAERRGLPSDFGIDGEYFNWGGMDYWMGEHSYTWLTLEELLSVDWADISTTWHYFVKLMESCSSEYYPVRIVIGFDS